MADDHEQILTERARAAIRRYLASIFLPTTIGGVIVSFLLATALNEVARKDAINTAVTKALDAVTPKMREVIEEGEKARQEAKAAQQEANAAKQESARARDLAKEQQEDLARNRDELKLNKKALDDFKNEFLGDPARVQKFIELAKAVKEVDDKQILEFIRRMYLDEALEKISLDKEGLTGGWTELKKGSETDDPTKTSLADYLPENSDALIVIGGRFLFMNRYAQVYYGRVIRKDNGTIELHREYELVTHFKGPSVTRLCVGTLQRGVKIGGVEHDCILWPDEKQCFIRRATAKRHDGK